MSFLRRSCPTQPTSRTPRGFTLIELLIAVAVVAILVSLAYPAYEEALRKGRRAQARSALAELLVQQERYMTQFNCYLAFSTTAQAGSHFTSTPTDTHDECPTPASTPPFRNYAGERTERATHTLSASACPNLNITQCVQLTATPLYDDPQAGALRMTSMGSRSCTGTAATSNPQLCWP